MVSDGAVVSSVTDWLASVPETLPVVLVTRALITQLPLWTVGSLIVQPVPVVVAVDQVVPPSNETYTTSFAPSTALIVPVTARVAVPSLVMKSVLLLPVSFSMDEMTTVCVGAATS